MTIVLRCGHENLDDEFVCNSKDKINIKNIRRHKVAFLVTCLIFETFFTELRQLFAILSV